MSTDLDDLDAVRAAVQRYVDACTDADSEALRTSLHPDWRMYGIEDEAGEEVAVSVDDYVAWVAERQPPVGYRATITHLEIATDVATATLVEEHYYDIDYVVFFSLVRYGGTWRIVTKAYSQVSPRRI
jgi:hypothetical protein